MDKDESTFSVSICDKACSPKKHEWLVEFTDEKIDFVTTPSLCRTWLKSFCFWIGSLLIVFFFIIVPACNQAWEFILELFFRPYGSIVMLMSIFVFLAGIVMIPVVLLTHHAKACFAITPNRIISCNMDNLSRFYQIKSIYHEQIVDVEANHGTWKELFQSTLVLSVIPECVTSESTPLDQQTTQMITIYGLCNLDHIRNMILEHRESVQSTSNQRTVTGTESAGTVSLTLTAAR